MLNLFTASQPNPNLSAPFSKVVNPPGGLQSNCPHIMFLDSGILLDELILELFCDVPNLHILITRMDSEETIAQVIISENPKVVILSESDRFSVDKLSGMLKNHQFSDAIQIVVVSQHENSLVIKNSHNHSHNNFKDFVNCIKKSCTSAQ
jgi:hypothetical protein